MDQVSEATARPQSLLIARPVMLLGVEVGPDHDWPTLTTIKHSKLECFYRFVVKLYEPSSTSTSEIDLYQPSSIINSWRFVKSLGLDSLMAQAVICRPSNWVCCGSSGMPTAVAIRSFAPGMATWCSPQRPMLRWHWALLGWFRGD